MSLVARVQADYRVAFDRVGENIAVRRFSGSGPSRTHVDTTVRARVVNYAPSQLAGLIVQGDRKVIVLANDALAAVLPVTTADKLVVRGRELAIKGVDDSTRRVAGVLIALEIQVGG